MRGTSTREGVCVCMTHPDSAEHKLSRASRTLTAHLGQPHAEGPDRLKLLYRGLLRRRIGALGVVVAHVGSARRGGGRRGVVLLRLSHEVLQVSCAAVHSNGAGRPAGDTEARPCHQRLIATTDEG